MLTRPKSLTTQERTCRDYCKRNGFEVDKEKGESAKTTDRKEFLAMLKYCRESVGRVQCVVVYALSRFSRQVHDHHAIRALLQKQGITLRSATEPIDESPMGKAMENIAATWAQFDNDLRAERATVGMAEAAGQRKWVHQAPDTLRVEEASRV